MYLNIYAWYLSQLTLKMLSGRSETVHIVLVKEGVFSNIAKLMKGEVLR